jgi:gliding motility-associated lipoprotein GldD
MKILKILSLIIIISFISCNTKTNYYPKPKSYIRIDFPEKKYYLVNDFCPFSFEIPEYSAWSKSFRKKDDCSKTIIFPNFKAEILCDYLILENNLSELSESFRKMVYEHSFKSSAIIERVWVNESTNVYGIAYEIKGNTALNYAFTVTDSSKNFFSGQLLFQTSPNYDSLKPSIEFIKNDIEAMIASFQWRD